MQDLSWGEWSTVGKGGYQLALWADHNVVALLQNAFPAEWTGWLLRNNPDDKLVQVSNVRILEM